MTLRALGTAWLWRQIRRGFSPWWVVAIALWAVVSRLLFSRERSSR